MKRFVTKLALGAACTATVLASTLTGAAPAGAAADAYPCGGRWWHSAQRVWVQNCPEWGDRVAVRGANAAYAEVPVKGWIAVPGDDWYVCQLKGSTLGSGGSYNNWWALTMADNGEVGWVNQLYFRGGGDYEPDAALRHCPLPEGSYTGEEAFARVRAAGG